MNVILDLDKLSYTTLERMAIDCGYNSVDNFIDKTNNDTERFKKEVKDAVMNVFKSIKIDISK